MAKVAVYLAVLVVVAVFAGSNGQGSGLCPVNKIWSDCPTACPRTCANPNPGTCTLQCLAPQCVCQAGYLQNGSDCVLPSNCPSTGK